MKCGGGRGHVLAWLYLDVPSRTTARRPRFGAFALLGAPAWGDRFWPPLPPTCLANVTGFDLHWFGLATSQTVTKLEEVELECKSQVLGRKSLVVRELFHGSPCCTRLCLAVVEWRNRECHIILPHYLRQGLTSIPGTTDLLLAFEFQKRDARSY